VDLSLQKCGPLFLQGGSSEPTEPPLATGLVGICHLQACAATANSIHFIAKFEIRFDLACWMVRLWKKNIKIKVYAARYLS